MNFVPKMNRRSFLVGSAAVAGGGLALGIDLPVADAQGALATPELGVWVVVKPDDSVVVRIVRAEMGQGTITGLAQLVAEELEADWSKVSYEHPTPGESVKRKRAWGSYSTGGSRGIRESHEYVRQGGAAARMMLMQAAANEW
jgi:isoquinoline 1-oxidoreductase beta subunit